MKKEQVTRAREMYERVSRAKTDDEYNRLKFTASTQITTLVGLTNEEISRLDDARKYEYFQLEEIERYYTARIRRRQQKLDKLWKLSCKAFDESDYAKWRWRRNKYDVCSARNDRDRACWHACLNRQIANTHHWKRLRDEYDEASKG